MTDDDGDRTLARPSDGAERGNTNEPLDAEASNMTASSCVRDPAASLPVISTSPTQATSTSSVATLSTTKARQTRAFSATRSPAPSRESSPIRPPHRSNPSAPLTGPGRPRRNQSQSQESSPSRLSSNHTSNLPSQRALSAASTPNLRPASSESPTNEAPAPMKLPAATESRDAPRGPASTRLKSPPPNTKRSFVSPRKAEHDLPAINVQRTSHAPPEPQEGYQTATDSETEDFLSLPGMRTPTRGVSGASSTLETVQESSQPSTPALAIVNGVDEKSDGDTPKASLQQENFTDSQKTINPKAGSVANESGSESGGKGEFNNRTGSSTSVATLRTNGPTPKIYSAAGAGRGKTSGEGSTRNMTVETETVSSVPQIAVGGATGAAVNGGSLRTKPSSETIRPKKDKKKMARKQPSVTSGIGSTKADIFEAKVASAVDEANSSDSEETFVYESNPPDTSERPRRFHSRTPSATSMASQIDQRNGVRAALETGHSVAMKKSMKFANSYNSVGPEATNGEDDGKGTARSSIGGGRGTAHHHHIGRWGRNGNGHQSLFDHESPFPISAKQKLAGTASKHSSRPTSPRIANSRQVGNGKKTSPMSYDMDDVADDERTPLIPSTMRSTRSGRSRRPASMRQLEHQASREPSSFLSSCTGCLILLGMLLFVFAGAAFFMFATSQPLADAKLLALKNVLASEQDLIVDLKVIALNPNLIAVTIDSADLVVFAKSKYAGTNGEWWKHPGKRLGRRGNRQIPDYEQDASLDDDPDSSPNLEIGHIYELDTPLIFDASPFNHLRTTSMGEVRVSKPGNHTSPGGSERWGRVLQHEFDLIIRGSLKYTLPLGQKVRSIGVEGRVTVKPNAADQDPENIHLT